MSGWNHRVLKRTSHNIDPQSGPYEEVMYGIVECFYSDDEPEKLGWTKEFIEPVGETLEGLRWTLEGMLKALDRPIIDEEEYERKRVQDPGAGAAPREDPD